MSSSKGGMQPSEGWEVFSKKAKSKVLSSSAKPFSPQTAAAVSSGSSGAKPYAPQTSAAVSSGSSGAKPYAPQTSAAVSTGIARGMPGPKAGGSNVGMGRGSVSIADFMRPPGTGRGNARFPPAIAPPLQHGWNWSTRVASTNPAQGDPRKMETNPGDPPVEDSLTAKNVGEEVGEDDDLIDDSDEELLSDGYDSDASVKSHGTRKKSSWFKEFFDSFDNLSVPELNDPERQWHCPGCKGGPGAIEWFKGLQPLMAHAKTLRSKRVNLHREFAKLLEEELRIRGTSVVPAGEAIGKWSGLKEKDFEIVWPPMVIIMNTRHEKDDNDKWTGMGNQELLDYFRGYAASRARHSYGPQGHRGMSVLIFEASAVGYLEAERLSKHFTDSGKDREAWQRNPALFYPGGMRQLYGYMAEKKDMDSFNQHCHGKTKLKFEMKSHLEMVVNPMKQMSEENQQLLWYKNKAAKHQKHAKALEESFVMMGEKYRQTAEETKIVRSKMKMHHEQEKEEKEYLEEFYKENFKLAEDENQGPSIVDDNQRAEKLARYLDSLNLEGGEIEELQHKMLRVHEEWKNEVKEKHHAEEEEMKRRHRAEEAAGEKVLNDALAQLWGKSVRST